MSVINNIHQIMLVQDISLEFTCASKSISFYNVCLAKLNLKKRNWLATLSKKLKLHFFPK